MLRCPKRAVKLTHVQRLEKSTLRNGYRVGIREHNGFYIGNWKNGKKQGNGVKFYNNSMAYEGQWVANKRHGFGIMKKKVEDYFILVFEGYWINNRYARGKLYEEDGVYEGEFSTTADGKKSGCGIKRWNDGAVYEGQWRDNQFNGQGFFTEANGNNYDGQWRAGLKHGEGVYMFMNKGLSMTGIWINGVPNMNIMEHTNFDQWTGNGRLPIPKIQQVDREIIQPTYQFEKSEKLKNL
ncbi:MORN motif [Cinara cedri]|uniref:MORN repeat-containing protein 3 n=1 Tax=Cinara cedri TaxID=506608 RepID=A0A5E4N9R7_9HEMI|nr:MORN motif [Cinara cedri]